MLNILEACYSTLVRGNHAGYQTTRKILQRGYYQPLTHKDEHDFLRVCDQYPRQGSIFRHHEIPITKMLEVKLFDIWAYISWGPLVRSYGYKYVLVVVEYVSKQVEVMALANNEGKIMVLFLRKNILSYFGVPQTIISDRSSYSCNKIFDEW